MNIVVIGSGLAGLCSTIEAARNGAYVTLIDKEGSIGGNSAKATSGINGVNTKLQNKLGIADSFDLFNQDTFNSGRNLNNRKLVNILGTKSNEAIEFVSYFGLELSQLVQCGGHSVKRTMRQPEVDGKPSAIGWQIISKMKAYIENELKDSVFIRLNTALVEVKVEDGKVRGVIVTDVNTHDQELIAADAVILASGGFSASKALVGQYAPDLINFPTTNGKFATGDALTIVEKLGASLVDMDKIQLHPTAFMNIKDVEKQQKFLCPESLRGHGAILINQQGQRFANELGTRDYLTDKIIQQHHRMGNALVAYLLLNQKIAEEFGLATLGFYQKMGLVHTFDSIDKVAAFIGCDVNELQNTLAKYGSNELYGKTVFPHTFAHDDATYYLSVITPCIHYTMGGVRINSEAELINANDEVVAKGLYGAGEVTGGVHGANRLAGNSLLECVIFGRIAAQEATKFINQTITVR